MKEGKPVNRRESQVLFPHGIISFVLVRKDIVPINRVIAPSPARWAQPYKSGCNGLKSTLPILNSLEQVSSDMAKHFFVSIFQNLKPKILILLFG